MMGLFSEVGRAWLTIDSDIYVSQWVPYKLSIKPPKLILLSDLDVRKYS